MEYNGWHFAVDADAVSSKNFQELHLLNFVNLRCVPLNETALVVVIAWNRAGPKPLFKPMVTQFTDSYMVKNMSKNKKTLFQFGTMKNKLTAALISYKY